MADGLGEKIKQAVTSVKPSPEFRSKVRRALRSPSEVAEDERLIHIAERTNANASSFQKAILVKELLMKAEGGMFPTPDDPEEAPKVSVGKAAPGIKAPPGYEAREVTVTRGGKTFATDRGQGSGVPQGQQRASAQAVGAH